MASIRTSTRQKLFKKGLLSQKDLLPSEFSDLNEIIDCFHNGSAKKFKDQNIAPWGSLGLGESINLKTVFLSRDKYLIMVYKEQYIQIYNFQTKDSLIPELFISPEDLGFSNFITAAAFCDVTKCLFVGSLSGEIARIALNSEDIRQSITPVIHSSKTTILALDVSSDGQKLLYFHSDVITIIDLSNSRERTYFSKQNYIYESGYFLDEDQSLLLNKVKRNTIERSYEIKVSRVDKTPKNSMMSAGRYAKLMQNKRYYVALRNISTNTKIPYTEVQVFTVDNRESPIRTFKFELHASADYDKLQFHLTNDRKYFFCHASHTGSLYIHEFTNQNTTPQCAKIPLEEYHFAVFADDDSCLALVTKDGKVAVCKLLLEADRILSRHRLNFSEGKKNSFALSDEGDYVAYFLDNTDVEVLDLRRDKIIFSLQKTENYAEMVSASIRFSNDEIIVEYKIIFDSRLGSAQEYVIKESLPPQGSNKVVRRIMLNELQPKNTKRKGSQIEGEEETHPLHVMPASKYNNPSSFKELGESLMPNGRFKPEEVQISKSNVWDHKSLPSFLEKVHHKFAVKSNNENYVFVISNDSTVNVYALPSLEYVCFWKNNYQRNLISLEIPKDDKFIFNVYEDGYVEIRDFNFISHSPSKNISEFYSLERYLRPEGFPLKESLIYPEDYPIPDKQTILHLKAISNAPDLPKLKFNQASKIPCLFDEYNKTPLHYLLLHDKLSFGALNAVATYVLEYMKALKKGQSEYDDVIQSLNALLPILLLKLQPSLAAQYVEMLAPIRLVEEDELESEIFAKDKTVYFRRDGFRPELTEALEPGQEQMIFKVLDLKINYRPESKELMAYTVALSEVEEEDVFKIPAVSHLVDYVWNATKKWNVGLFLWFSLLMIFLSVSVGLDQRNLGLDITILVFTSIGMIMEIAQAIVLRSRYWITIWNKIDLISLILIYAYVIHRFYDSDDELAKNWVVAFTIFTGYIRLAAYLRLFDQTRELIEVIVTIIKDMVSFLTIMGMITIGFSLIFLKFLRNDQEFYLWHLYYSYQLWYGNTDGDTSKSPSVLLLECVIMFIMPVVLLNLLVTLMGESRDKIKEQAVLTDARTRLVMSIEALTLIQAWSYILPDRYRSRPRSTSLVICMPKLRDQESESDKNTNEIVDLKQQVTKIEKNLKDLSERQTIDFQRLEEQVLRLHELKKGALKNEIVEQSQKNEELENQNKNQRPDVEFERINQLLQGFKTELLQHTSQETIEIRARLDRILRNTETNSTANNVISNNVQEDLPNFT